MMGRKQPLKDGDRARSVPVPRKADARIYTTADLKAAKLEMVERLYKAIQSREHLQYGITAMVEMTACDEEIQKIKEEIENETICCD